ncbi:MAG: FAD-dependent oxidoreductase [Colwellia sp.]|nr:FAD-dependent oxidoreductase [Colwellia sp.]NQZ80652.1 FAD-dependent oxidoreductase [Colwellia sp.]
MENCIIVGGGISGLFSAIIAKEHCDNVTVIESSPHCGGLLRSWKNDDGVIFDLGTHIPFETQNDAINRILFKGMYDNPDLWTTMKTTKVSNYFMGKHYGISQFIPLQYLTEENYKNALVEILSAPGMEMDQALNFEEYSLATYGQTITYEIFKPLLKKIQNAELNELHPSVHSFFSLNRFIPGDAKLCQELKKSAVYDAKLAFATFNEGVSASSRFYPKARGIELWVKQLVQQAEDKGVVFKTSAQIKNLQQSGMQVCAVELNDEEILPCDHLIWSIPPIVAIKQLNIPYQGITPKFCPTSLHHLVFDQPFIDKNYYSNIHDWNCQSFRLTMYPNMDSGEASAPYSCTVEVLCSVLKDKEQLKSIIVEELKTIGYVNQNALVLSYDVIDVPFGFPQFTTGFVAEKNKQIDLLNEEISNITLIGKASKDQFFIAGVLQETYDVLNQLFN